MESKFRFPKDAVGKLRKWRLSMRAATYVV
jgi:hypothetical protein